MGFTIKHSGSPRDDRYTEIIELTKQLIAIPSVSGDETAILRFVADWLNSSEFDEVIQQQSWTAGVVRAAHHQAKRALILCGHIDTVTPGDTTAWSHHPWQPYEANGRLYGLGASDMKAGVALQLITARSYLTTRRDDIDLWCVTVAHEEVDGAGSADFTRYFAEHTQYDEVYCMIAEPTDGNIEIGHRGNRFVEFVFKGQAGHASQETAYEHSALPGLIRFLNHLPQIRHDLHQQYPDHTLGQPSFTPTRVSPEGSYASNQTTAASCVAVDIRTTPSLDAVFDSWIDQLAHHYDCSWRYAATFVPSALCREDAAVLQTMQRIAPQASVTVSAGATDQAFFQSIGAQTIIYGPGDFDQAHAIDESVSLQRLATTYELYQQLIKQI